MSRSKEQVPPTDPDSLEHIADVARELDALSPSGVAEQDAFRVLRLYRRASELHERSPGELLEFLLKYVVPSCLGFINADGHSARDRSSFRVVLAEWLDSMPEITVWQVRPWLLEAALNQVLVHPTEDGLYLLMAVGFYSSEVLRALRDVSSREDSLGDLALRLLASASSSSDDIDWIRQRIAVRIALGQVSDEIIHANVIVADEIALGHMCSAIRDMRPSPFFFGWFGRLCERKPGDYTWQNRIWDAVLTLADYRPNGWRELLLSVGVFRGCQTDRVAQTLAARLPHLVAKDERLIMDLGHRMGDLLTARQLSGLSDIDANAAVDIRTSAVSCTGDKTTAGMTVEAHLKEAAWQLALTLGCSASVDWVEQAIENEMNPYQQHNFMERLAILAVPRLPPRAIALLRNQDLEFTRKHFEPDLLPYLAATRLAASASSPEALVLLMKARGVINGNPFRAPVEGAADAAAWLFARGNVEVLELLLDRLVNGNEMGSSIAARALRWIAESGPHLPARVRDTLEEFIHTETLPYVRADAIATVVLIGDPSNRTLELLGELCGHGDEQLRSTAAHSLIKCGALERFRARVESCALRSRGPTGAPSSSLTTSEAYLAGRLAAADPSYGDYVAAIIRSGFEFAVMEAVRACRGRHFADDTTRKLIVDAIVDHIRRGETLATSNTYLFEQLKELDPERLLIERWEDIWNGWMPESRRALADALVEVVLRANVPDIRERAIFVATALIEDGSFLVRRSAARSLCRLDMERIMKLIDDYWRSGSIVLREHAAELSAWVPIDDETELDNSFLRKLAIDPERRVRDAARRSRDELRRRTWALDLRRFVTDVEGDGNDWVLKKFAYGTALAKVGDDEDEAFLSEFARLPEIPPNVRHWIRRVVKDLEKQWRETTRKWPNSWRPWSGRMEVVMGELSVGNFRMQGRIHLWWRPSETTSDLPTWGGAGEVRVETLSAEYGAMFDTGKATLKVDGRAETDVLIVHASGAEITFHGSGPYPTSCDNR
jgi:hypothetical protein